MRAHHTEFRVVRDRSIDAQRRAAGIWARATARRDGLGEDGALADKLPGIRSSLRRQGASLHLASHGGRAVGFALLVPGDRSLEVLYLGVDPATWGRGVGACLLRHVESQAMDAGFRELELWVIADNRRATALYERSGWAATDEVMIRGSAGRPERRFVRQVARGVEEGRLPAT